LAMLMPKRPRDNGEARGAPVPDVARRIAFAEGMIRNPLIAGSVEALAAEVAGWRAKPGKVLDIAAGLPVGLEQCLEQCHPPVPDGDRLPAPQQPAARIKHKRAKYVRRCQSRTLLDCSELSARLMTSGAPRELD
jgi:hypothetical protein